MSDEEEAKRTDGGPAFAIPMGHSNGGYYSSSQEGMSLRDYMAVKAMQALLSRHDVAASVGLDKVPKTSYMLADEMLKERGK